MNKKRKIPQRMCLGCRENKNKRELVRVVRTPDGDVVLDSTGKRAGRGAYICQDESCFKKAIRGKGLEKNLRCSLPETVVQDLKDRIEELSDESPKRADCKGEKDKF